MDLANAYEAHAANAQRILNYYGGALSGEGRCVSRPRPTSEQRVAQAKRRYVQGLTNVSQLEDELAVALICANVL